MFPITAPYPIKRSRRIRQADWIRSLVSENVLSANDLIWPIFVCDGTKQKQPIKSLPGVYRHSIDQVVSLAEEAVSLGIPCIAIFPNTPQELKSDDCAEAWNPENLVNKATRLIKSVFPNLGIILDVALDPYNSKGHDGFVRDGEILNDETLIALQKQALTQASAGADILGPSDMMDGRVGKIREILENKGYSNTMIMSYSAKYASSFYGPFRDAVGAKKNLTGDKKTYQMDCRNINEAIREVALDLKEGADMVMVKPGLPYLDVCRRIKDKFQVPTFAYQVSGEYAMLETARINGLIKGDIAVIETLISFKRAGCDGILTYYAPKVAKLLA
ncbi:MAG: porphobilinogen synthase [Pseudomonadota bacterium]|nr:porphobilinogen synthase [Pseudomonadota bacterium]